MRGGMTEHRGFATLAADARTTRWWLALAYALATVLSQFAHDHGRQPDPEAARATAHCDSSLPHVADDPAPRLDDPRDHCLACQFRATHLAWMIMAPTPDDPVVVAPIDLASPSPLLGSILRPVSRAPPCA